MLDAGELGDDPSVPDELPGEDYPPDRPVGVRAGAYADDGSVAEDDVATRETRLEPETGRVADVGGVDLLADADDEPDVESELLGEASEDPAGETAPAEVAAMHVIADESALDDTP